jgi:hypothetical protein
MLEPSIVDVDVNKSMHGKGRPWQPKEDTVLLDAVASIGPHWKLVQRKLTRLGTWRTEAMCQDRFLWLNKQKGLIGGSGSKSKKCGQLKRGHIELEVEVECVQVGASGGGGGDDDRGEMECHQVESVAWKTLEPVEDRDQLRRLQAEHAKLARENFRADEEIRTLRTEVEALRARCAEKEEALSTQLARVREESASAPQRHVWTFGQSPQSPAKQLQLSAGQSLSKEDLVAHAATQTEQPTAAAANAKVVRIEDDDDGRTKNPVSVTTPRHSMTMMDDDGFLRSVRSSTGLAGVKVVANSFVAHRVCSARDDGTGRKYLGCFATAKAAAVAVALDFEGQSVSKESVVAGLRRRGLAADADTQEQAWSP